MPSSLSTLANRSTRPGASRAMESPASSTRLSFPTIQRQRSASSCACGGTCPRCQAKSSLTIGAANDAHEQEADRVADAVMRGEHGASIRQGSPALQTRLYRKVLDPDEVYDSAHAAPGTAEREILRDDDAGPASLQRKETVGAADGALAVPAGYERSLQRAVQGGGSALPPATRGFMESRFGHDFSGVRVHHDAQADALSRQIDARAFTLGQDIFFGRSEYAPASGAGQRLLAHELTHVVQQASGKLSRQIRRVPRTPCSAYPSYDPAKNRLTYNCAGLALRSYEDTSPPSAVYTDMEARFTPPYSPADTCLPGEVKFWLWEYNMHPEDAQGNVLRAARPDFHIVAGRMDAAGGEPAVYSKNGRRPIHGPAPGPSFRPATRERALDDDDQPAELPGGRPFFKVRSDMIEQVSCAECL
ncbi:hypothetical protein GCM10007387_22980 [Pseudoduganella albidiflava]|nr:hypothetical protein GCM10007387_22980 [Pseudoduganella albidiflava]